MTFSAADNGRNYPSGMHCGHHLIRKYRILYYIILCYIILYYIMLYYIILYYVILYYIILYYIYSIWQIYNIYPLQRKNIAIEYGP